jgi:enterochelin esterase-like enzyme
MFRSNELMLLTPKGSRIRYLSPLCGFLSLCENCLVLSCVMRESIFQLNSSYLENQRRIWICEPDNVSGASDLVVFLDGERYRDRVGALTVIGGLRGQIADSWFVFVSEESPEARWRECPCYPPFARFVGEELLTWLASGYIDFSRIKRRVLAGLSYTGLAAAFVAKEYPDSFQKIISQSGSFWWKDCWLAEEFRRLRRKIPVDFYLDVGAEEIHENIRHRKDVIQVASQIEGVRRFRDALVAHGHEVRYNEFDGGHDYALWSRSLVDGLKWSVPLEPTE